MHPIRIHSVSDQATNHLRQGITEGRWGGRLPGVLLLSKECNVSPGVIRAALKRLEAEGVLLSGGSGRCRRIKSPEKGSALLRPRRLRIGILLHDPGIDSTNPIIGEILRSLEVAGYIVVFGERSQVQLKFNVSNIISMVRQTPVDAWIICAGIRGILEWFAGQSIPSIALFGRADGLSIARTGPDHSPAFLEATRQLMALGHRRIVFITLAGRRKPNVGTAERLVLEEMQKHGIETGPYNLPDWEETPKGFNTLLGHLFKTTPPTALFIEETDKLIAAMQFLACNHIDVPGQVSLVLTDFDWTLNWCYPPIAHMDWNVSHVVRRIVRWVDAVAKGNPDRRTNNVPSVFVPGGSIGPAPQGHL